MQTRPSRRLLPCLRLVAFCAALGLLASAPHFGFAQTGRRGGPPPQPTLGVENGLLTIDTPDFTLKLVKDSQTLAALEPKGITPYTPTPRRGGRGGRGGGRGGRGRGANGATTGTQVAATPTPAPTPPPAIPFDFAPVDQLTNRSADGFNHLGDLTMRLMVKDQDTTWTDFQTSAHRKPVTANPVQGGGILASADLSPTLPENCPVQVTRTWKLDGGKVVLQFDIKNKGTKPVTVGALGMPLVFNNFMTGRSQEQEYEICTFADPYPGLDAGYVQVTRLTGKGPALVVVPEGKTPLEAWYSMPDRQPRQGQLGVYERSPRQQTQEGVFEWMVHTKAYADNEWKAAKQWNTPTEDTIAPGATMTHAVKFLVSPEIRDIDKTVAAAKRPVAVGLPGYVAPMGEDVKLFLNYDKKITSIKSDPSGALDVKENKATPGGWKDYTIHGKDWGRARLDVAYEDGTKQTIHYYVIKPQDKTVADLGNFLFTKQWFDDEKDPFHRAPSPMTYNRATNKIVTQDKRTWMSGLEDEGGAGGWIAAEMKEWGAPKKAEIEKFEQFIDKVLWGHIQYATDDGDPGHPKWGVRKSLFYYGLEGYPYDPGDWSSWTSWLITGNDSVKRADWVTRAYNYPHVVAAYYTMYDLARNHTGLVNNHPWDWYLNQAYETTRFMADPDLNGGKIGWIETGLMEGDIFVMLVKALKNEGMNDKADVITALMKEHRADKWNADTYPFGSEMAWDSTGQEEVYAWCTYFGYDAKATVALNSILGYMPTVPHWGYNGNARRYWDFIYGAAPGQGIERQLHHYGSGINAIPVLAEYRKHPDDYYLLRIGYAGTMGAISNIDQDGFAGTAFHSYPDKLRWDNYSGDYGPSFFGHAVNSATYIINHPEFGWQALGGNVTKDGDWVKVKTLDSFRKRVFIAPRGLWLTLDAGKFDSVEVNSKTYAVRLVLAAKDEFTPDARLRIEEPAKKDAATSVKVAGQDKTERGATVIALKSGETTIELSN